MGITSICYVLSILKGINCKGTKEVSLKDYGDKKIRNISLLLLDYDNLKNEVQSVKELIDYVQSILSEIPKCKSDLWKFKLKMYSSLPIFNIDIGQNIRILEWLNS